MGKDSKIEWTDHTFMRLLYLLALTLLVACNASPTNNYTPPMPTQSFSTPDVTLMPTSTVAVVLPSVTPTSPIVRACRHDWDNAPVCNMPYSILVHSTQKDWLANLLPTISDEYIDTTYNELFEESNIGNPPRENHILISIDDLSTYYLPSRFYEMIENMRANNIVGTLAVVTEYIELPDPEIWAYYRQLQSEGWEIAIHTEHHYNFSWISDEQIELEIRTSYGKICENTNSCPVTLILPFGEGMYLPIIKEVAEELGIVWIVGTEKRPLGSHFTGQPPWLVSRALIVEDVDEMFEVLTEMFPFKFGYGN